MYYLKTIDKSAVSVISKSHTLFPGLPTPADQQQHGDAIDLRDGERQYRVDDVAQPRVLEVHDGWLTSTQVVA
jgi:hypothetical protein